MCNSQYYILPIFEEQYPELVTALEESAGNESISVQLTDCKNGMKNLQLIQEETGRKVNMYSSYSPDNEIQRWLESISPQIEHSESVILFGLGLGYHLEVLIERFPDKLFFVYEPSNQVVRHSFGSTLVSQLLSRNNVKFSAVQKWDQLFYMMHVYSEESPALVAIPFYQREYKDEFEKFQTQMKNMLVTLKINENNDIKYRIQWIRNTVLNLPAILSRPSIKKMKSKLEGKPAIIVGSGPSLNEDLSLLKSLENRFFIIAAGTSTQALERAGITPHLIVTMDGGHFNNVAFKNVKVTEVPKLVVPQVHHGIVDRHINSIYHAFLDNDLIANYHVPFEEEIAPVFYSTFSVTGTAIQAASYFGCEPILMTGQDLSYPNMSYYAEGVTHLNAKIQQSDIALATETVENVNGDLNATTPKLYMTLKDIENLLALHQDKTFINTSRNGASIKYTRWAPLQTALEQYVSSEFEPETFTDLIEQLTCCYTLEIQRSIAKKVSEVPQQLELFRKKSIVLLRDLKKLREYSRTKPQKCISIQNNVQRVWSDLYTNELFKAIFEKLLQPSLRHMDRELMHLTPDLPIRKISDILYQAIEPVINDLLGQLPAIEKIYKEGTNRLQKSGHLANEG
ncbi:DUF115 domain-containing protein [Paenibacillus sp. MER TA 81-3]|uniref:motility associated factor glycosyltransferase family protein n=1 Tax=Paenibacillus sp. MER TA 81-3 TaxID=2939573 RepID=UPI00203B5623|nr:6-hydroxymethylpterin diphosphokinase MptE-like protein [Paenibacillus sp. MER TA 81-3]MCM3338741.1 DUF115 domain-containing protein [Paenibacillus sp. MER TA 81-3]